MRSSLALVAGFLLLVLGAATARADVDTFVAVDSLAVTNDDYNVTTKPVLALGGVLTGQSTPVARAYVSASGTIAGEVLQRCEKLALLAQGRPGRYTLAITRTNTPNSGGSFYVTACRLTRVN